MKSSELVRLLKRNGCVEVRQAGSHLIIRCGKCQASIPVHKGQDIKLGTLRAIEKALGPCLPADWKDK